MPLPRRASARLPHALAIFLATVTLTIAGDAPPATSPPPLVPGEVVERVVTRVDPTQSYALYLPRDYDGERASPILYCFEPRSRGMLCVDLFRDAAERHGYVIASSNNSRSDGPMEPNIAAMKAMWKDTHELLAIDDERVLATGFSGGARVANIMGQVLGIAGVIAVGGGYPPSAPPRADIPFDFFALVGEHDFNYYELRALALTLEELELPHRIDVFPGRHEWAPPERCGAALDWMELRAMRRGRREVDPRWLGELWRAWVGEAEALESGGELVRARDRYRSLARDFDGLIDVSAAVSAAERLSGDRGYRRQRKERERWDAWGKAYLDRLANVLTRLREAGGPVPTAGQLSRQLEVRSLLATIEEQPDSEKGRAARRVLEMVRVQTGFTQVRHYLSVGDYSRAAVCLELATEITPDNAVVWYNLACARARTGAVEPAIEALTRAVDEGFTNADQLRSDPDLASLRDTPEFVTLLERLPSP